MISIDYKDRRPMYEQIIDKFQQQILCGVLEPDSPMPSVRSLAMELSLNPNTIQRAYQELERSGYIYTIKGKGSFVSDTRCQVADNKRIEIKNEIQQIINKAISIGITEKELEEMFYEGIAKNGGVK
ncbi:MAG: GntR family transcriptional regulator [Lachnospiraceae bacterium]|nr:GntR family transcriptional regulator [Lachnospiraceae bacterium]MEE0918623.1 GntR family transcriptional regulator [Lachnospiraceae bacterium]